MHLPLFAQIQETTTQAAREAVAAAQQGLDVPTTPPDTITVWELLSYGGWGIMLPLAIMSVLVVYITIERLLALGKALKSEKDLLARVRDYVHEGKVDSALNACAQNGTPSARVIEKGLQRMGKPNKEIESAMESVGQLEMARLERGVGLLSLVAKLAPMFGFIGTIIGVIKIFYDISLTDNISIGVISSGLYQKMVTSAAGLVVGIIGFACYFMVSSMLDRLETKLNGSALAFMDILQEPLKK
ncbi:MAG: MotA/TolQ/ExbB proton channel family protein [Flavobacteriales bacterium]|nr:MotA/TolQ/ExbB proton channel family protein [Flavobacteriales bacterium]HRH69845.1 MotA/TolQ/ExbB proton channel family protein [Flavobacteriales bacterium]